MGRLDALLREGRRVLTPGSAEAPYALSLAVLMVLLAVLWLVWAWRRARRPGKIEQLFLASHAATRKAREISELDLFARRVTTATEDIKGRIRKLRLGHYQQVKIYIDHSNFITTWTQLVHGRDRALEHDIDWARLPQVLLDETGAWLEKMRNAPQAIVYRGTNVYGTLFDESYFKLLDSMLRLEETAPAKLPLPIRLRKETIDRWREENEAHRVELMEVIQKETGYQIVPIVRRTPQEHQLASANFTSGGIPIAPEKMLDTCIATDLVGDATFDVYDIALLVTEDSDFIPAVDFVQEMRKKPVVHVGFGGHSSELRAKCRYRIDLRKDDLFRRMQRGGAARQPGPVRS